MPPSPSMRRSPARELRGDNHNRGRSLEGGLPYRDKDDDLTLFNELETRERDNFLLQSNDDFDDILSAKLRYFSSNKLGISVPARGETSDMLNANEEKNDYEWLITPPDTPLFRSLDDEPPPVTLAQRGRPRSKPITISRSSTMEKSYTSSRGSASPNRLSPSPRSGNNSIQSRGRPSSAPSSSPTPSYHQATPLRRPSPPPKTPATPATPAPRSSTPTSRRIITGPASNVSSSGKRGASPVNKGRGNSASPKAKAWQTNIPGFSSDPPPNLRTSLGDRPASFVRGSSPASRNGRQSMSPTASRSASSSYSHDRDRFSSNSKGSIASSGDDDLDSLQSVLINSSDRSVPKRVGAYSSNHAPSLSRKSTRAGVSSSAPKRSFDSALRHMDQRKVPQNMFRPLLSSVPTSTFYVGKSTAAHRTLLSNSSVTTSSNASSDQGPTGVHDAEGSDYNQDDIAITCVKAPYADVEDDIFILEKTNSIIEDISPIGINGVAMIDIQQDPQNVGHVSSLVTTAFSVLSDAESKFFEINNVEDRAICSECGCVYPAMESTEGELNICPDCRISDEPLTTTSTVPALVVSEVPQSLSIKSSDDQTSFVSGPVISVPGSSGLTDIVIMSEFEHSEIVQKTHTPDAEVSPNLSNHNTGEQIVTWENVQGSLKTFDFSSSDGEKRVQLVRRLTESPSLKLDVSEGRGISILLKRSGSAKGPFVQSRSFTATSISFDDLSYVRDCPPSMRSSSSSLDINPKHKRSGSSLSGTSSHALHGLGTSTSVLDENTEISGVNSDSRAGDTSATYEEQSLASESGRFDDVCTRVVYNDHDGADLEVDAVNIDDSSSCENVKESQDDNRSISDEEDGVSSDIDTVDLADISTHCPLETISEIETENGHPGSINSRSDVGSPDSSGISNELQELSVSARSDMDVNALVGKHDFTDHSHGFLEEEATVTVEDHFGTKTKSLTLEEATDAILFCSSIVHNIANEAATIAVEKEKTVLLEGSRPTVTILGNSNTDRREPRGKPTAKRTTKSQKIRKRRVEKERNSPSENDGEDGKFETTRIVGVRERNDSMKPPKLESKCNCTIM